MALKKAGTLVFALLLNLSILAQEKNPKVREKILFDFDWRFAYGHPFDKSKDFNTGTAYFSYLAKAGYGDGAASAGFDDRAWRRLNLPHDWAVEQGFSPHASFSHGFKTVGPNFAENSVGWYRKSFSIPASDLGRRIVVEFDGVFRNSIVWVNGHYLGTEESGYISFSHDITDYLNYGGENTIAVRVDASMEEGWFYEGAGIYRHVWLTKTNPLHVTLNGTFVTSQVDLEKSTAVINAKAVIVNEDKVSRKFSVIQTIVNADGQALASRRQDSLKLSPFQTQELSLDIPLSNVRLWDLENPYRYKLITSVISEDIETDRYETKFGVRTIRFDAKEGFFLNGKHVKLKGTNNHQDHAGVGTAMPDELQDFRIRALKAMGSNAYRCSHNPPAPELLEACDRLGMLVINENRLMGTTEQRLNDLKKMIIRDRNHPSIIAWSIGNEEWAIENSITGERIAVTMQEFTKSIDPTRPVTVGVSGGFQSGISDVIEVMGYNYLGNGDIDTHHKRFPNQPGMGTEEGSTFATRGIYTDDLQKNYLAAYDQKPRPTFYSIQEGWKFYASRPYLAGIFIWTGFDYRGEPTPFGWPSITSYFGMMDLCGFPKDNVWYLKSWWRDEPVLHLLPHWNWKGQESKEIAVWAYSNCDEVELFLNKKSLGKQTMPPNSHLEWKVKYQPGTLEAIGYKNGERTLSKLIKTTGEASAVQLVPHKTTLKADAEDIAVITVSAIDKNKLAVPDAGNEISFSISGPAKIIGVGNGDPTSLEKDKFIEDIKTVKVTGLKEQELEGMNNITEALAIPDNAEWKDAFTSRDYKKLAPAYIHRGSFELPDDFAGSEITFFYKSIGREQTIYINGKEIGRNLNESKAGNEFRLDKAVLKSGKNQIDIIASPIPKKHDWETVNTDPGTIQIFTPPAIWKRKLFNGLAQIIIQTTGKPGDISLTASSPGLKPVTLKLKSEKALMRYQAAE